MLHNPLENYSEFFGGGVWLGSPNPDPISDQTMQFSDTLQGPMVRKPINAYRRLKINQRVFHLAL